MSNPHAHAALYVRIDCGGGRVNAELVMCINQTSSLLYINNIASCRPAAWPAAWPAVMSPRSTQISFGKRKSRIASWKPRLYCTIKSRQS